MRTKLVAVQQPANDRYDYSVAVDTGGRAANLDMTEHSNGWRDGLDEIDAALLDEYQSGFPVRTAPFDVLAEELETDTEDVLERLRSHAETGIVRRVGPVLDPSVIGSSTLAALSVPAEAFSDVAAIVNGYPQVSHNYRRDHELNMWFVLTASTRQKRDNLLAEIATRSGYEPVVLPKRREYCLDLQFPIVNDDRPSSGSAVVSAARRSADGTNPQTGIESDHQRGQSEPLSSRELSSVERAVLEAIQDGIPLSESPYRTLAADLELDVATVVSSIETLRSDGFIKRIGVVVSHRTAGFRHNCMVAWDVPDDELDRCGTRAGSRPYVTKCYHRPRRPDRGWEYNLFTMIHGRDPKQVDEWITELANEYVPAPYERLDTTEKLKQTGTRYESLLDD